ncbi:MAG: TetR/AcrR family transcriptional regulator [Cyanobacteriota bacterium]
MSNKKQDKSHLLMDSALKIFVEKGFQKTKIKDITDNASLAAGTFYLYFKNKDELIDAIFQRYISQIFKDFEILIASNNNAKDKIITFIEINFDYAYKHLTFFQFYIEYVHTRNIFHPKSHMDIKKQLIHYTEKIIIQGQKENIFRKDLNPTIAALSLRGMIVLPIIASMFLGPDKSFTKEELVYNISENFLKGLEI